MSASIRVLGRRLERRVLLRGLGPVSEALVRRTEIRSTLAYNASKNQTISAVLDSEPFVTRGLLELGVRFLLRPLTPPPPAVQDPGLNLCLQILVDHARDKKGGR